MSSQLKIKEFKELYASIAVIGILAILGYGRIFISPQYFEMIIAGFSLYSSNNLPEFLNTGFIELRRGCLQGTFLYYFLKLHKTTDNAYWIWQSIILLIQIASPIFLYLFAKIYLRKMSLWLFDSLFSHNLSIDTTISVISNIGLQNRYDA